MKKILSLTLALAMLFTLAACGEPEDTKNQDKQPGSSQTTTTQPEEVGTKTIYVLVSQTTTKYEGDTLEYSTSIQNYYDDNGLMVKQERTDKNGTTVTYTAETDEYGRVVRLSYTVNGSVISYTYDYDKYGNVIREVFDREVDYVRKSWKYDASGNLLSYKEEELFSTISDKYIYEDGKLHSVERYYGDLQNRICIYDYDSQGRIAHIFYHDPGEDTPWCTDVYSYSDDGLTTYIDREFNMPTLEQQEVTVVDAYGNIIRQESIEGSRKTVTEYTYQAIEIPADTPRKNG